MRIARIASSFSLVLLAAFALAGPYGDLSERLKEEDNLETILLEAMKTGEKVQFDRALQRALDEAGDADPESQEEVAATIKGMIAARALAERGSDTRKAKEDIQQIKASPIYRDPGEVEETNWLSGAANRLSNISCNCNRAPQVDAPSFRIGPWLTYLAWGLIGATVLVLIFVLGRHFSWKRNLKRRASALLEEDEPERTLDEWLELADRLIAEGRHREAIRCLYLACLLRFDEAKVARFDRSETNWEHLARIDRSPGKPQDLDFRPATQLFDRIWYGKMSHGISEVEQFRRWYSDVTEALKRRNAA